MSQILSPQVEGGNWGLEGRGAAAQQGEWAGGITVLAVDDWGSQQDGRRKQEKRGKKRDRKETERRTQKNSDIVRDEEDLDTERETTTENQNDKETGGTKEE